jgi:hypothetical protein
MAFITEVASLEGNNLLIFITSVHLKSGLIIRVGMALA